VRSASPCSSFSFKFEVHRTYTRKAKSKQPVKCALFSIFENFHYTDTIVGERSIALMFQANIGPAMLNGVGSKGCCTAS